MLRFSLLKSRLKFFGTIAFVSLLSSVVFAQNFGEMIRSSEPLTAEEELGTFKVPDGFRVELFAAEPDIQKPMNLAFDAQGRLWVSGSNDYPYPNLTDQATDSIRILEDTNNDGKADKFTTFVDGITIPMGLYPYRDGVIAFTIPNITFFRDTDGDGKADKSEVLYGPFDYSRDTHGLNNAFRRGLDGWIYACHGFNNRSQVAGVDGHSVSMQSGNTYRFKVDGSRIEHHTHGQVNPFGMTFDSWGDLYSSDCHTVPVTLLLKDGSYPSFGRPHDGLGFTPAVMTHLHGSTAIAGLAQYTGSKFPDEYNNSLFVGNVMTSRVHRDVIKYTGSSVQVVEQPDFLTSSDPWFRPVDIQSGPDQTLYIADFYNRIIGHYEVPLDHPGRDRHRARIWRVTYDGGAGNTPQTSKERFSRSDITQFSINELIHSLSSANLSACYRSVEQLVERGGAAALPAIREALHKPISSQQHAYLLWSLHRLEALQVEDLQQAFDQQDELLQVHVLRILAESPKWAAASHKLVVTGLHGSPMVARSASLAMAKQPSVENISAILDNQHEVPASDVHLLHSLKIALRNSLQLEDAYGIVSELNLSEERQKFLAEVSLAVKSEPSAKYILSMIGKIPFQQNELKKMVTLAARHLQVEDVPRLIEVSREFFSDDVDLQAEILLSLLAGLQQQGRQATPGLKQWGEDLVQMIFTLQDPGFADWAAIGVGGGPPLQWDLEPRKTADAPASVQFISSLPAGERTTGILRSKPFEIPESLSFYVCGHLGFPKNEAILKNFVSLHLEEGGKPIQLALAPRNDIAQKVTWDLSEFKGQQGFLQVTDGIDLRAYAWIAVHGIEPPVVTLPAISPKVVEQRLSAAMTIINQLDLPKFKEDCLKLSLGTQYPVAVRFEALRFVSKLNQSPTIVGLLSLFREESMSNGQRDLIADLIVQQQEVGFQRLLKTLALKDQIVFARALTQFDTGAHDLAALIENGAISPRVIQSAAIKSQIDGLTSSSMKVRLLAFAANLPSANVQLDQLIENRKASYQNSDFDSQLGKAVFKKNCSACHSLEGIGKKIGPQLDGIGNRGIDRLLEDVLAPNRNIDLAFRSHTYLLEDGKVQSGLFRRKEGELTVIANQKGEEVSFATSSIEAEKVSALSIMPENWGATIPEHDFNHLLTYLLRQRVKREAAN